MPSAPARPPQHRPGGRRRQDALPHPQEYSAILTPDAFLARVSADLERDFGPAAVSLHAQPFMDLVHPADRLGVKAALSWLRDDGKPVTFECRWQHREGNWRWLEWTIARRSGDPVLTAIARDVTRWREDEALAVGQARVLERMVTGAPQREVLEMICTTLEGSNERLKAAVFLVDRAIGQLQLAAAPSMEESLRTLLAALPLGGSGGAAVAAANQGGVVISSDLANGTLWTGMREVPLSRGVRAEWAVAPQGGQGGQGGKGGPEQREKVEPAVVVAAYLSVPGEPTPRERQALLMAGDLARLAVTSDREDAQHELLIGALASAGDVVMVLDSQTGSGGRGWRIAWVNRAFERRVGIMADEAKGQGLAILRGPETDRAALERIEHALDHGHAVQQDLLAYGRLSGPLWLELDLSPVRSQAGITGWVVIGRDVTGPKLAEEALARSEEHVARALAAAGMATLEWDAERRTLDCSDTFGPLFGLPHGAAFDSFDEVLMHAHPDDRPVLRAFARRVIREEGVQEVEWRTVSDAGAEQWLHARVRPERDRSGKVRRVSGVLQAGRVPVVRGEYDSEAGEGGRPPESRTGALEAEPVATEPVEPQATSDAVTEASTGTPAAQPVLDLSALIAGWSPSFRSETASSASLHLRLAPDVVPVFGDAEMLRSAIVELVRNAAEALDESGGVISLATGTVDASRAFLASAYFDDGLPPGRYAYVEVSDTGRGMDAAVVSRMFDPTYSTRGPGRGAGLSRVLTAVRTHHGAVQVYSKPDIGTTVRVLIPTEVLSLSGRLAHGSEAQDETKEKLLALGAVLREMV